MRRRCGMWWMACARKGRCHRGSARWVQLGRRITGRHRHTRLRGTRKALRLLVRSADHLRLHPRRVRHVMFWRRHTSVGSILCLIQHSVHDRRISTRVIATTVPLLWRDRLRSLRYARRGLPAMRRTQPWTRHTCGDRRRRGRTVRSPVHAVHLSVEHLSWVDRRARRSSWGWSAVLSSQSVSRDEMVRLVSTHLAGLRLGM